MAKFNYRLQALLNVKKQLEDTAQNELGKQLNKLDVAQKQLNTINEEKNECCNRIAVESINGIQVSKLKQYNYYFSCIEERLKNQMECVNNTAKDVDICREELIKASKEKKILETLKDKKYQEHIYEQLKAEEKVTDEIVSYRYSRSRE